MEEAPEEALRRALAAHELAVRVGERRVRWRAARVAQKALAARGRLDEADRFREDAVTIAGEAAAGASGWLRDAFLARPDVAELLT